jgi:hypothetical protein
MDQLQQHVSVSDCAPSAAVPTLSGTAVTTGQAASPTVARRLDRDRLINRLNYLTFQDRSILLAFEHARYHDPLRVEARPLPCQGSQLRCTWVHSGTAAMLSKYYVFSSVFVPDTEKLLQGTGEVTALDEDGITIELSGSCAEVDGRRVVRYPCRDIRIELLSFGSRFEGVLLDFSPLSFRVRIALSAPRSFAWLNTTAQVTVVLSKGSEVLYSGECRIVSATSGRSLREYVLEPTQTPVQRFEPKQYRSIRQHLVPAPTAMFEHPFSARLVSLKVLDVSGCGLAVEENARNAVLLPGLMIPRLDLCLSSNVRFRCRAQVVYRQPLDADTDTPRLKCGLALLDMDVADHVQLVGLLQQASDGRSYVCSQVDLDALWSFFFETGFIYPKKYGFIHKSREQIKATYEKLYTGNPSIARHFICQDQGQIVAHMAMVRFFGNTWLIHHHAALGSRTFKAGLNVLAQIARFITDGHRFPFMHMDYVICFYRPENHFPARIFGGACRSIDDPRKCSEAVFAYAHLGPIAAPIGKSHEALLLAGADEHDLRELATFCRHQGAGLTIPALDLEPGASDEADLIGEFARLGLKRERHLYVLKRDGRALAMLVVNLADVGLNLSDLTNCVTLFVLEAQHLTKEGVEEALAVVLATLGQPELPLLVYPEAAARELGITVEKRYVMWTLMPCFSDGFHRYTDAVLRAGRMNRGSHDERRSPPV